MAQMTESSMSEWRTPAPPSAQQLRFLCRLGQGGMAEVHLAASIAGGVHELVVVKRMHAQHQHDRATVEMFLDEARLGLELAHPNIVRTRRLGMFDGRHGIVMEFLEGQPLHQLLKRAYEREQTLSLEAVAMIGIAALAGLEHAHQFCDASGERLHIVHRDVSPQNVFITYDGVVKLLDFGIAKTTMQEGRTRTGLLKGKLSYMAPEQGRGEPLDQRADLWSLGVMLWEAATGARLFKGANEAATLNLTLTGEVPPPSERRADMPAEFEAILMQALQRDRDQRYPSAASMRADLVHWLEKGLAGDAETTLAILMQRLFSAEIALQREKVHALLSEPTESGAESGVTLIAPVMAPSSGPISGVQGSRASSVTDVTELVHELTRQRRATTRLLGVLIAIVGLAALAVIYLWSMRVETAPSPVELPAASLPTQSPAMAPVAVAAPGAPSLLSVEVAPVPIATKPQPPPWRSSSAKRLPARARAAESAAAEAAQPQPQQTGLLNLDTAPWSVVSLAGRVLGQTPIVGVVLPAGSHALVLANPELGLKTTYQVTITAGQTTARRVGLD